MEFCTLLLSASKEIDKFTLAMELFGGLALFLFGMEMMTDSLKLLAGAKMKGILAKLTTNRVSGVFSGAFVTSVVQSSSVTTVLVVGFISAGLLTLTQAIPIIMGANIGTTITAQIVAFKITKYALLMIGVGFVFVFFTKQERVKNYGLLFMGLGLVFFGMSVMSGATKPLRTYQPFIDLMTMMDNPFMAIGVAALFTGIIQSSSATTSIVIVLAKEGQISLEAGIALAMGANIGTCVTAMLAAIGKPVEAVRGAMVHLIFNISGVLIWFGFIGLLADWVTSMSPESTARDLYDVLHAHDKSFVIADEALKTINADGLIQQLQASNPNIDAATATEMLEKANRAVETPRQIANAHTLFNVANTAIFIWFVTPMATLVTKIIPDRKTKESDVNLKFLDNLLLDTPDLALNCVRKELQYLGEMVIEMFDRSKHVISSGTEHELTELRQMDLRVDKVYSAILDYLSHLSQQHLTEKQAELLHEYMVTANYIETIGDEIRGPFVYYGRERLRNSEEINLAEDEAFENLHDAVRDNIANAFKALGYGNHAIAEHVILEKNHINHLADVASEKLADRLTSKDPNRLNAFRTETDLVENLKHCYYYAKRIAKIATNLEHELDDPDDQKFVPNQHGHHDN